MSYEQIQRLYLTAVLFIASCVYVPWSSTTSEVGHFTATTKSASFSWIWDPPAYTNAPSPDMKRLGIIWAALGVLSVCWVLAGRGVREDESSLPLAKAATT